MVLQKIDDPENVLIDMCSTMVISNGRAIVDREKFPADENGLTTLDNIYKWYERLAGQYKVPVPVITVIYELGIHGYIYRYGNHGQYWELIGETCGYA